MPAILALPGDEPLTFWSLNWIGATGEPGMSDYSDSEANYPTISYSNGVGVLYQNHIRLLPQSYRMGMESVYGKIFLYRRMGICSLLLLMRAGLGTVVMLFSCDLGIMDSSDRNSSLQSRGKAVVLTCFKSMSWVIENKTSKSASKVAVINLKLQDYGKTPAGETEVQFRLTRVTLEPMLRSMTYISQQLSTPGNRVAVISLKLQDTKTTTGETEVKFQVSRDTLGSMLRSMAYVREQL